MNRVEALRKIKPLFVLVLSQPPSVSILRELALLSTGAAPATPETSPLLSGVHRRYLRLCRLQGELAKLDLKKAKPGVSLEDFVFSKIDFLRYREMEVSYFEMLFLEGLKDFDDAFFRGKFSLSKTEVESIIEKSYKKTEGLYKIQLENSMILSVMRTLETSLEDLPLFTPDEAGKELKKLPGFADGRGASFSAEIRNMETLFPLLVSSLDNVIITHDDSMETNLRVSAEGNLEGIFRPDNKPWTRVLVPNYQSASSQPTTPARG